MKVLLMPSPTDADLGKQPYNRFAISMPAAMADDIRALCHRESRSHSEFFREAVRSYLQQRLSAPAATLYAVSTHSVVAAPSGSEPVQAAARASRPAALRDDAFADFTEWAEDKEYNQLSSLTSTTG
jgi:Arc/MetJ-type ribon-helix-helix transcriptional regulator